MKRLLIVVDYQKDFVDGSLGFNGAEKLDARIAEKIASYRATGDEVAFTFDTHHRDYLKTQEGRNLPIEHCVDGTPDSVRSQPFTSIELVGLVSNICVISNAVLAKTACPEVPVIVDASCTGSGDAKLHEAALDIMEGLQIQVINR